ncbi:hypothetical protein [Hyalangium versicolor]|uniref:hypothetical protein n=1 Tax=Hyalangium versicolor TaxID=2861190 RepID=UPI001CC901F3|nr:hypothetical protein [Hyalangium versicolor]
MKRAVLSVCVAGVVAVVGCTVSVMDFAGKKCEVAEDCPDSYVCVAARPGAGRTCEALGLPGISDGGEIPTGPVPTWCTDVQPLLANYCLSSCHGTDHSNSGRTDFQLDIYESAGGVKGALEMAPRIEARAVRLQDMPPMGSPAPTAEEREILGRWAQGGAPFCDTDGGVPSDGGVDGGTDGGK